MMRRPVVVSIGLSVLLLAGAAWEIPAARAGGMTVGDLGAHAEGRSGAFVAKADDMSAIEYNPAGLTGIGSTQIYTGNRFGYAAESFTRSPVTLRDGTTVSFDESTNEHPLQLLNPMIAVGSNFGLDNWAFALGAYAPPGIAAQQFPEGDYNYQFEDGAPRGGGQRWMLIERDVKILYYNLSVAWKFKNFFGIGASLQWVDAAAIKLSLVVDGNTFDVVNPAGSPLDFKAEVSGADHFGFSAVLGAWIKPLPFLHVALSGRVAPTPIEADCTLTLSNTDDTIDEPTMSDDKVTLSMKLPPMARAGVRYIHKKGDTERFDLELDLVYEAWHVMDRYTLDGHGLIAELAGHEVAVNEIHIDKQWKDTISVRFGGDYRVIPKHLTLRAGFSYESSAQDNEYAYVDFFAGSRLGGSFGLSVGFFGMEAALSYNYIYTFPFSVAEADGKILQQVPGKEDPTAAAVANAGDYSAHYHFGTVTLAYTF